MIELQQAYPGMLKEIRSTLLEQLRGPEEGLRESLAAARSGAERKGQFSLY